MSEIMNGYELLAPFQNQNAGFSRWTYAKKNNQTYFIKEFLDPVYPTDFAIDEQVRTERVLDCEEYEEKKKKLYETINQASDGNLVRIHEFFRCDSHYYITTEMIDAEKLSACDLMEYPIEDRSFLCKTIAHSMMRLHQKGIVHADIKPDNILIRKTNMGKLVGKIIDFDASFFEYNPPEIEDELGGDQVYLSPEACLFMVGEESELSVKMDVFALGLLFHQYLTGELPGFDTSEYDYAFDAILDGNDLQLSAVLSDDQKSMIDGMLKLSPEERLTMEEVYAFFNPDKMDSETEDEQMVVENASNKWFFGAGDL